MTFNLISFLMLSATKMPILSQLEISKLQLPMSQPHVTRHTLTNLIYMVERLSVIDFYLYTLRKLFLVFI
jgi:hypothetical protein